MAESSFEFGQCSSHDSYSKARGLARGEYIGELPERAHTDCLLCPKHLAVFSANFPF